MFTPLTKVFPYSSLIMAVDYFQEKYPGTTIVFDMSLSYIVSAFASVFLNNMLVSVFSMKTRIYFGKIVLRTFQLAIYLLNGHFLAGYVISLSVLLFISVFEVATDSLPRDHGYHIVLISTVLLGVGCTVQQSSFYGFTSMLPKKFTQGVMAGESMTFVKCSDQSTSVF